VSMNRSRWVILSIVLLWSSCTYNHFDEVSSLCAGSTLSLTLSVVNSTTCGASDGQITISAKGGVKDYSFSISGESNQTDSVYNNLKAGSYTIVVNDAKGCTATQIASVNNAKSSLQFSTTTTANSGCPTPNGTLTITATGGQGTIQYQINNGTFQSSNQFTGLAAGAYSITVADQSNCVVSGTAKITTSSSLSNNASFQNDINPIIANYCATSGCHNGSRSPNLSSYTGISNNASSIVNSISRNMPPGGRLTVQQMALITCWVNAGAPNN